MTARFNTDWNPHYDFSDEACLREIKNVDAYSIEQDGAFYVEGQCVDSPWGSNEVVEAGRANGTDFCVKKISVKPGHMLSLQRHRGREELWEVKEGTLTVVLDGERHDVPAGKSISIGRGSVHCMINSTHDMVVVMETQKGQCREKDNVRLLDFNNRPTYPLTSETEYRSALLYAAIHDKHAACYGFSNRPHASLLRD